MAICMLIWKNQDQVLIDGLLEPMLVLRLWERTREILPWLSFKSAYIETFCQPLHGLWKLLHIIKDETLEGRLLLCWQKIYLLVVSFFCCFFTNGHFSGGTSTSIHPPRLRVPRTRDGKTRIIPQRLRAKAARRQAAGDPWASVVELTPDYQGEKNRCKRKPVVCKW